MDTNWRERANGWLGFYTLLEAQEQLDVEDFENMDQISTLQNLRKSFFERFESEHEACAGGNERRDLRWRSQVTEPPSPNTLATTAFESFRS